MADANAGEARRAVLPLASPRSLFGADGAEHAPKRAWWEPRFAAISDDAIAEIAERHIASWPRGRPFRLLERMRSLAPDVFGRLILQIDDPDAFVAAVRRILRTPGNPPLPVPASLTRCSSGAPRRCGRSSSATGTTPTADRRGRRGPGAAAIALTNVAHRVGRPRGRSSRRVHRRDAALAAVRFRRAPARRRPGPRGAASLLAHRDPHAFPDPHAFRTDRTTGTAVHAVRRRRAALRRRTARPRPAPRDPAACSHA